MISALAVQAPWERLPKDAALNHRIAGRSFGRPGSELERPGHGPAPRRLLERARAAAQSAGSSTRKPSTGSCGRWWWPGSSSAVELAELAMEETGFGVFEDKVIKNYIATEFLYDYLKDKRSVGVIAEDPERGIQEVAEPIGVVLALTPITNPTSTVLFKSIVAAKTRNAIVFRPSARAARCAERAVEILHESGELAGLPPGRPAGDPRPHARRLPVPLPPPRRRLHLDHGRPEGRGRRQPGRQALHQRGAGQRPGLHPPQRRRADGRGRHADLQDVRLVGDLPGRADLRDRRRDLGRDGRRARADGRAPALRRGRRAASPSSPSRRRQVEMRRSVSRARTWRRWPASRPTSRTRSCSPRCPRIPRSWRSHPLVREKLMPVLGLVRSPSVEHALEVCDLVTEHGGLGHTSAVYATDEEVIERFAEPSAPGGSS